MTIRNPCDNQQVDNTNEVVLICPIGFVRVVDENGVQTCQNMANLEPEPEVQEEREFVTNPFASNAFLQPQRNYFFEFDIPLSLLPQSEESETLPLNSEMVYVSATRDLTTMDHTNFYDLSYVSSGVTVEEMLQVFKANHSSIWLNQKSNQGTRGEVDKFRVSLFNFWNFNGLAEQITHIACGDPRILDPENPRGILRVPPLQTFEVNKMLQFRGDSVQSSY